MLGPPVRHRRPLVAAACPIRVAAFASGWMRVSGARTAARRRAAARDLRSRRLARAASHTIDETGAEEIWVTHGREEALVHQIGLDGPHGARAGARRLRGRGVE